MTKKTMINFRIDLELLDLVDQVCRERNTDRSKFIILAIKKALESEGIESPKSPAPPVIDSSINVSNSLNIDELKELLEGDLKPLIESIAIEKLESQIDEIKEAQNAINDKIYQRLENLENQSATEVKPLEMETEKATSQLSIIDIDELPQETKEADNAAPLPYEKAVERAKELSEKGYNFTEIANDLKGKYYTARKSINWERTQVERIVNPEKGKTKKSNNVANKQHD